MANLKVGTDDCERMDVLDVLLSGSTSSQVVVHWKTVAQRLKVPDVDIIAIEKKYHRGELTIREVYDELLVLWIGIKQDGAVISTFIEALEKVATLKDAAGNLRKRFRVRVRGANARSVPTSACATEAAAYDTVAAPAAKKSSATLSHNELGKMFRNNLKQNTDSLLLSGASVGANLELVGFLHDDWNMTH